MVDIKSSGIAGKNSSIDLKPSPSGKIPSTDKE